MGRILIIDAVAIAVAVVTWYVCFTRYNRRRGLLALRRVEAACSNRARIVEARWIGSSRLQAHLNFAARWFENARLTIRLLPRPVPTRWLISHWHGEQETVTFEADLDCPPSVQMEVFRHHWLSNDSRRAIRDTKNWVIGRPGPVLLTTSTRWKQDLPPIVNTLMTSRGHSLLSVRFRPDSPHLAATIALDALSGEREAAGFLAVLRDLAAGASASRQ